MYRTTFLRLVLASLVLVCAPARALADGVVQPWDALGHSLGTLYSWPHVLFQASAVALTPPLVLGIDEPLQLALQEDDPRSDPFGEVANIAGYVAAPVLSLGLYGVGAAAGDDELATAGAAAIQAVVVQGVMVRVLKLFTDRASPCTDGVPSPGYQNDMRCSMNADDFEFDPRDIGEGRAWPSGHTSASFAIVSALVAFYPDELWLALVGYPIAAAIGLGMIEADYHWLSDVVAGGLIGHSVGWAVGKTFRREFEAKRENGVVRHERRPRAHARIALSTEPLGLRISGDFF